MRISKDIKVIGAFIGVIVFQITWHLLLLLDNGVSRNILGVYLAYNPVTRKSTAGWLDFVLPGIIVGVVLGRIGWKWAASKLMSYAIVFGVTLILLRPIYFYILKMDEIPWEPLLLPDYETRIWEQIVGSIITVGAFTYGGRQSLVDTRKGEIAK